ncbi:uncharacterized protein LOC105220024 isoform X2 [Zeugodacus cucurbitae]|uniref:uncharacterized protein LOC105220024 isoform X2 n=1 Tax=Zeugodacus cucurbitae TaxID=28588 RepID=UPI0023D8EF0D|nr:uncharacterized protein LOC105220024 isoform X2 [Zeugodacus cucurbitae]
MWCPWQKCSVRQKSKMSKVETAGKLRRMNAGIPQSFVDSFNNSCNKCNNIEKLLTDKISELTELVEKQNTVIIDILAEHTVLLEKLSQKEKGTNSAILKFPIKTDADIAKLDADINDNNRVCYISAIQYLLQGQVKKNFEKVLSRQFCLEYNIGGIANKKRLKDFGNVYTVLKKAIGKTAVDAEAEIRKAFQVVKKRHFRQVSFNKVT